MAVSYLLFRRLLGRRESLVMGVGLTAKFSTSVISENLLFTSGLMAQPLYTAMMAAFIILKPIIVAVFSRSLATVRDTVREGRQIESVLVPEPAVQGVVHDHRP
jgi:hypothetical protein